MMPDRQQPDRRTITQTTAREAVEWVRVLASYTGCAGWPACDGHDRHCAPCEAQAWLQRHRLARPVDKP
jgi:hypothetical protein